MPGGVGKNWREDGTKGRKRKKEGKGSMREGIL